MTVIVYKDGILATDTGRWRGEIIVGEVKKILITDKWITAGAGSVPVLSEYYSWVRTNFAFGKPEKVEQQTFGALLVRRQDQKLFHCDASFCYYALEDTFSTEGAAEEFLFGLHIGGMGPIAMVESAIKYHSFAAGRCIAVDCTTGDQLYGPSDLPSI